MRTMTPSIAMAVSGFVEQSEPRSRILRIDDALDAAASTPPIITLANDKSLSSIP